MAEWIRVADVDACPPGKLVSRMAGKQPIVLINVDGAISALEDRCSHEEYPLSDGELEGGDLVCIYHGARYDARTGKNKGLPAIRPVKSFPVDVRADGIYIEL